MADGAAHAAPTHARLRRLRFWPPRLVSTTSVLRRWSAALLAVQESARDLTSAARLAPEEGRRSLFGRREYQREGCATARRLADMNAAFVRLHDFVDHGEAQAGPLSLTRLTAPETLEDALAILGWNTGAMIGDAYCALAIDTYNHLAAAGRVVDGVLDQVPNRILKRVRVPFYLRGLFRSFEGNRPALCQRPRSHGRDNARRDLVDVRGSGNVQCDRVQPSYAEKLLYQPVHARHIALELCQLLLAVDRLKCRGDDGKWRAQLVSGICRELALNG